MKNANLKTKLTALVLTVIMIVGLLPAVSINVNAEEYIGYPPTRLLYVTSNGYMSGDDVFWVQKQLVKLNYSVGSYGCDKIYGWDTASAVYQFQKATSKNHV